ncbi:MAG: TetR/AcrR family transcriptional regulator C-terminal domain-containing protein, partial [Chloroflexota bacterium]
LNHLLEDLIAPQSQDILDGIEVTVERCASNMRGLHQILDFDGIEDVLRLRSDEVFEEMIQQIITYVEEHGNPARVMLLKPVLRYFYTNSEIIELLIQADRLDIAMASFHQAVLPFRANTTTYYPNVDEDYIDFGITIRLGMVTNILVRWIKTGKQQPPDELAETLVAMIHDMVTLDQLL